MIVAAGIGHAAERRHGVEVHADGGDHHPGDDQVIDLDRLAVCEAEQADADLAVGLHATLAAEEVVEHRRRGGDKLDDAEGDHGECGGTLLGRHVAEHDAEAETAEPGEQRHQFHRHRQRAVPGGVEEMHGGIAREPEQHRMAERQQSRLAHQHVERQGEDDHHAGLAEHRKQEAGVAAALKVVEQPGQHNRNQQRGDPRPQPDGECDGATRRQGTEGGVAHVSRVPISPRGRNSRITISST